MIPDRLGHSVTLFSIYNNNNWLNLYSAFLDTQRRFTVKGDLTKHPLGDAQQPISTRTLTHQLETESEGTNESANHTGGCWEGQIEGAWLGGFRPRFPLMRFRNISIKTDSCQNASSCRNAVVHIQSHCVALVLHQKKGSASNLRKRSPCRLYTNTVRRRSSCLTL